MKNGIYLILAAVLMACSHEATTDNEVDVEKAESKSTKVKTEASALTSKESDTLTKSTQTVSKTRKYNGRWFSIDIPIDFSASPLSPEEKIDNYSYIETDEARFTSPDGTVEFFIYSPQWSGNPKDYLTKQPNEKIVDEIEEATTDIPPSMVHHWVTFEDKNGKYTRAYHSIRTRSTHHVFGVKYTDEKSYERYKAKYIEFQKSLQQYAD